MIEWVKYWTRGDDGDHRWLQKSSFGWMRDFQMVIRVTLLKVLIAHRTNLVELVSTFPMWVLNLMLLDILIACIAKLKFLNLYFGTPRQALTLKTR